MSRVWSVNIIHTPWVSHGYEPIAFFSTRDRADAYRDRVTAERTPEQIANPEMWGYGYKVQEWEVDA